MEIEFCTRVQLILPRKPTKRGSAIWQAASCLPSDRVCGQLGTWDEQLEEAAAGCSQVLSLLPPHAALLHTLHRWTHIRSPGPRPEGQSFAEHPVLEVGIVAELELHCEQK